MMNKKLDLVVEEAVSSLFWFEPYVVGQKQEFQAVIKEFENLFGKVKRSKALHFYRVKSNSQNYYIIPRRMQRNVVKFVRSKKSHRVCRKN